MQQGLARAFTTLGIAEVPGNWLEIVAARRQADHVPRRDQSPGVEGKDAEDMTDTSSAGLEATVVSVLEDTVQDWDIEIEGGIGAATTLIGDLAFESIDVVQFCIALEQAVNRKGLPFETLFIRDGAYVDDVTVAEVAAFLETELARA
jgi:acyl carrier protein